jgi:hypothetical protein
MMNTKGQNMGNKTNMCMCSPGWKWDATTRSCCLKDCSTEPHSTGTMNGTNQCACDEGWGWDYTTLTCSLPNGLNCKADPHAIGINTNNYIQCICM